MGIHSWIDDNTTHMHHMPHIGCRCKRALLYFWGYILLISTKQQARQPVTCERLQQVTGNVRRDNAIVLRSRDDEWCEVALRGVVQQFPVHVIVQAAPAETL